MEHQWFTLKFHLRYHWIQTRNLCFSFLHYSFVPKASLKGYFLACHLSSVPEKTVGIILPYTNKNTSVKRNTEIWLNSDGYCIYQLRVEEKGGVSQQVKPQSFWGVHRKHKASLNIQLSLQNIILEVFQEKYLWF